VKNYKILSSKNVYTNPWIKVREDKVIRPGGKEGIFGVVKMKAGSTVLAINSKKEVYLIKEYKYAIQRDSIELMSGGLDNNELPLEAAKRELKEETGLEAKDWIDMGVVDPFTTIISSSNYMFLALDVKKGKQELEEGERIQIVKYPFKKVIEMVMSNKITHSASCVCILKAARYLEEKEMIYNVA
jgi:8-oxo-dGTP pyrophosphatase MutT (NUDIX family)